MRCLKKNCRSDSDWEMIAFDLSVDRKTSNWMCQSQLNWIKLIFSEYTKWHFQRQQQSC